MDLGEFNRRGFYAGFGLDYRLRLWAATSASRSISAVAELLQFFCSGALQIYFNRAVLHCSTGTGYSFS